MNHIAPEIPFAYTTIVEVRDYLDRATQLLNMLLPFLSYYQNYIQQVPCFHGMLQQQQYITHRSSNHNRSRMKFVPTSKPTVSPSVNSVRTDEVSCLSSSASSSSCSSSLSSASSSSFSPSSLSSTSSSLSSSSSSHSSLSLSSSSLSSSSSSVHSHLQPPQNRITHDNTQANRKQNMSTEVVTTVHSKWPLSSWPPLEAVRFSPGPRRSKLAPLRRQIKRRIVVTPMKTVDSRELVQIGNVENKSLVRTNHFSVTYIPIKSSSISNSLSENKIQADTNETISVMDQSQQDDDDDEDKTRKSPKQSGAKSKSYRSVAPFYVRKSNRKHKRRLEERALKQKEIEKLKMELKNKERENKIKTEVKKMRIEVIHKKDREQEFECEELDTELDDDFEVEQQEEEVQQSKVEEFILANLWVNLEYVLGPFLRPIPPPRQFPMHLKVVMNPFKPLDIVMSYIFDAQTTSHSIVYMSAKNNRTTFGLWEMVGLVSKMNAKFAKKMPLRCLYNVLCCFSKIEQAMRIVRNQYMQFGTTAFFRISTAVFLKDCKNLATLSHVSFPYGFGAAPYGLWRDDPKFVAYSKTQVDSNDFIVNESAAPHYRSLAYYNQLTKYKDWCYIHPAYFETASDYSFLPNLRLFQCRVCDLARRTNVIRVALQDFENRVYEYVMRLHSDDGIRDEILLLMKIVIMNVLIADNSLEQLNQVAWRDILCNYDKDREILNVTCYNPNVTVIQEGGTDPFPSCILCKYMKEEWEDHNKSQDDKKDRANRRKKWKLLQELHAAGGIKPIYCIRQWALDRIAISRRMIRENQCQLFSSSMDQDCSDGQK